MIRARAAADVEALRKALGEAEEKAVQQQAARKKLEARVKEIQQELQDAVKKCETLEHDASAQGDELAKARRSAETARNEAQAALQEIQEAKKITVGKAFKMQSKYAEKQYLLLTRVRSSPGAFADLPRSVSDAAEFYQVKGGGFYGEAILVVVRDARASRVLHRSAEAAGGAAQGGRTSHEGFDNPAMASRSYTRQLFRTREAASGGLSEARGHQALRLHRRCPSGPCPCKGALG